jgi:PAS domain S-box-containing protein
MIRLLRIKLDHANHSSGPEKGDQLHTAADAWLRVVDNDPRGLCIMGESYLRAGRPETGGDSPNRPYGALDANLIIANAPDPVFVSDLEGKILQANEAVSTLLGFRPDEVLEQSLSRFISPEETREFTAALREVVEKGVTRNARLNPRSASGEIIPTSLNASALRDPDGNVIGAIGILRDIRAYERVLRALEQSKAELQEKILDLEKFEEVVVGRELKMIALEKELENLRKDLEKLKADRTGA